jgi:hypothetical protein
VLPPYGVSFLYEAEYGMIIHVVGKGQSVAGT